MLGDQGLHWVTRGYALAKRPFNSSICFCKASMAWPVQPVQLGDGPSADAQPTSMGTSTKGPGILCEPSLFGTKMFGIVWGYEGTVYQNFVFLVAQQKAHEVLLFFAKVLNTTHRSTFLIALYGTIFHHLAPLHTTTPRLTMSKRHWIEYPHQNHHDPLWTSLGGFLKWK